MKPRPTGVSRAGLIFFVSFFYQEKKENRDYQLGRLTLRIK